jgi:hypothetical protein
MNYDSEGNGLYQWGRRTGCFRECGLDRPAAAQPSDARKMVYDVSVEYVLTSAKIVAAAGCVYRWLSLFRAEARLLGKVEGFGACLKALMPRLSCSIGVRSDCP